MRSALFLTLPILGLGASSATPSNDVENLQKAYLEKVMDETLWDTFERVKATDMTSEDFSRLLGVDTAAGDQVYTGSLSTTGCYKSRVNGGWGYCGPPSCVSRRNNAKRPFFSSN